MGRTQRRFEQFLANPSSVRRAVAAISSFTVLAVVVGAFIIRVFDQSEYPTFGRALWFTLQTVTTVGYGDATPEAPVGRVVASIVMLTSIGLITVVTAAVTSTFVTAANRRDAQTASADHELTRRSLDELTTRLDHIDRTLDSLASRPMDTTRPASRRTSVAAPPVRREGGRSPDDDRP